MPNVSVKGPIVTFHEDAASSDDRFVINCPEYLLRRERVERAAAKSSATAAAQRAHQELAQLLQAARMEIEPTSRGHGDD